MSICATIGAPVVVEIDACIHDGFVVFDEYDGRLDTRFLYHFIRFWTPNFRSKGQTGTQANLNTGIVKATTVPSIPLDEQQRITEILDAADEAIRKTEALVAKLKQMKAGLLHDLLTRGLDDHGHLRDLIAHPEQFKESPLGAIPVTWDWVTLSSIAVVERGKFTHRPRNDPAFYGGIYPFIQTGDVAEAEGDVVTKFSQCLSDRGTMVSKEFPANTVAVTIAANIADTAILGRPMYFPDSVVGVVVQTPHNPRYVELCIRSAKRQLDARAPQSAQKNINLTDLRPLPIPLPHPDEQQRIAARYEVTATPIRAEQAYLHKLKRARQGLTQDLLTGRVRTGG
jgi:type I restriction enzyme S subunit